MTDLWLEKNSIVFVSQANWETLFTCLFPTLLSSGRDPTKKMSSPSNFDSIIIMTMGGRRANELTHLQGTRVPDVNYVLLALDAIACTREKNHHGITGTKTTTAISRRYHFCEPDVKLD